MNNFVVLNANELNQVNGGRSIIPIYLPGRYPIIKPVYIIKK